MVSMDSTLETRVCTFYNVGYGSADGVPDTNPMYTYTKQSIKYNHLYTDHYGSQYMPRSYEMLSRSFEKRSRSYEIWCRTYEMRSRLVTTSYLLVTTRSNLVTTRYHRLCDYCFQCTRSLDRNEMNVSNIYKLIKRKVFEYKYGSRYVPRSIFYDLVVTRCDLVATRYDFVVTRWSLVVTRCNFVVMINDLVVTRCNRIS